MPGTLDKMCQFVPNGRQAGGLTGGYQASPNAAVRGSAAAPKVPVSQSTITAALAFIDHGPRMVTLWPRRTNSARTESGMRPSRDKSPGYMVCGKDDAGKLRVLQRGASMACCAFMPKSTIFTKVWIVRMH